MPKLKKISQYLLFISLFLSIYFLLTKPSLPPTSLISPQLINFPPIFSPINKNPYQLSFDNQTYNIIPKANYELYGLVVASYDAENILDVTHDSDPAQFKDLCLIWGSNLSSGAYKTTKYKHGEFTCYYQYNRENNFNRTELSNNHLIPSNNEIKKLIKKTNIGDQVKISGELIDYRILDKNNKEVYFRNTSDNLEDQNCEIILVKNFEILSNHNQIYSFIKTLSYFSLILSIGFLTISFFI